MVVAYDVIVVGAGHAGAEAAVASATLGAETLLITMDMTKIAAMSCNPAIGGIAKGQIVREIDALGGQQGIVTDAATIQFRMLNKGKGAAVWSPRAQCDRQLYSAHWRKIIENTDHLHMWQDTVVELLTGSNHEVIGVKTLLGMTFMAGAVVITAGTFLNGMMHIGATQIPGGRAAEQSAVSLTASLTRLGLRQQRMKTGTPPRVDRRSVHFDDTTEQYGDEPRGTFSYLSTPSTLPQQPCYTLHTTPECHDILRAALPQSPLYNGQIQSIGPRYCPSIETKLTTFPDKSSHPLFLEPEGTDTNEMYLNGFSSSMPIDIQLAALRTIPALRDIVIYRPAYAIEYDCFDPTQLTHSLESKVVPGLFLAGQVNGTTGYEEAAAQGLIAGINAAHHVAHSTPFTLARDEAYIGVLIDDLVTKGVDEPYRMFTSRAEYRILLRQDNADARLTARGHAIHLATTDRWHHWQEKDEHIQRLLHYCRSTIIHPIDINSQLLTIPDCHELRTPVTLWELVARPQLTLSQLAMMLPELQAQIAQSANRYSEIAHEVEVLIKYDGYITRERESAEKMHRLEDISIRDHFDYSTIHELSIEARQKLARINPATIAQASRIPGVSPADINVLLVLLHR